MVGLLLFKVECESENIETTTTTTTECLAEAARKCGATRLAGRRQVPSSTRRVFRRAAIGTNGIRQP